MPGYPTDRVIVYNRDATFAFELTPDEQRSRMRIEEINGEHSLTIQTTRKLTEGMRLITQDDTGKIREHVVYKVDEGHHEGKYAVGTYLCMWSLQYDLMSSYAHEHAEPGMGSSCTSRSAVVAALDGQALWTVGTCDVPAVAAGKGCVMIGVSAWERLSLVVKHWHGEIDAEIVMDDTRVVSRKVNFLAHLGSSEVKRRFDWAEDLTSIDRHEDPGPYYCRVVPLGRGQREYAEDDETEFDWPIDITEETGGVEYIEDSESAQVFRTKLPDGSYHYPTKVVKYDEDDPELLLNTAQADLHNHTRPGCSYEANVLQFVRAGMDAKGVQLGDNTQCVDFGFNPDAGLTVEGRVTRLEVEELSPESETNLTIGDLAPTFAQTMQELIGRQTASISDGVKRVEGGGTIVYLQNLLDEINAEINGTGGYSYLVPGEGIITYDRRVADPLIGTEATQVTQIKGGNIRIANTKKPSFSGINDWEWKTVIVSGHIAAELVTVAHLTAGYIGNSSQGSYWDLDSGILYISNGTTMSDALDDARKVATNYITDGTNGTDFGKTGISSKVRITNVGMEVFDGGNVSSAKFASDEARIGRADRGHAVMKTDSLALVGADGVPRFQSVIDGYNAAALTSVGIGRSMGYYGTLVVDELDSMQSGRYIILQGYFTVTDEAFYWVCTKGAAESGRLDPDAGNIVSYDGNKTFTFSYESGGATKGYAYITSCDYEMRIMSSYATIGTCADAGRRKAYSVVAGQGLYALNDAQLSFGKYNTHTTNLLLQGGYGSSPTSRSDKLRLTTSGNLWISGTLTQNSDRRLKEHHAYLGDDACDFIRALKPALYTKDGARHTGFYAQDVQEAEPEEWDTDTVTAQHTDESLDFDPLTLDYQALIAPLVAYAQQLEKHVDAQDETIVAMEARLAALEARLA